MVLEASAPEVEKEDEPEAMMKPRGSILHLFSSLSRPVPFVRTNGRKRFRAFFL